MIAVTGAAGFIGSGLVWRLNQRGERDILCVDTDPAGGRGPNLAPLHFREYVTHEDFLKRLQDSDWPALRIIYHLGACSSTTESNWEYLERNNVTYSKELCECALARGIRFVHAGSAATYGDGSQGYSDDHSRLRNLTPLNLYGRSKHLFDLWALERGHLDRIAVLKYFNVFGPNEWHKGPMRSMVCKGYEQIRDRGTVRLFRSERPDVPDGGQRRDFVYVKDAVDMTLWIGERAEANGVFNAGSGEAQTWNRLARAIFSALREEPRIEYIEMPADLRGRYQYHTCAEMEKLHGAGYATRPTTLEDAVADYVTAYLVPGRHLGE